MQRKEIVLNYLQTWFLFDLLASFPYSWIIDPATLGMGNPDASQTTSSETDDGSNTSASKTP